METVRDSGRTQCVVPIRALGDISDNRRDSLNYLRAIFNNCRVCFQSRLNSFVQDECHVGLLC